LEDLYGLGSGNYKHQDVTQAITQSFYEVYNELGAWFSRVSLRRGHGLALTDKGVEVKHQHPLPVWFRSTKIGDFRADLLVANAVIVELKAARTLEPVHEAQLLNYLRASDFEVGLLLNFGPTPKIKRLVFGNDKKRNLRLSA
jgi:GxxExxY protein